MNNKHIALLLDVDNVDISLENFHEIVKVLKKQGSVDYIKLYGYNERKHTNWSDSISYLGVDTCTTMRFRKRNKSQLDLRQVVDALNINYTEPNINTFCIVAGKGNLVPLLATLRLSGKHLLEVANFSSEINGQLFNDKIALSNENDYNQQKKNEIGQKLRQFSERTAAMAMEDSVNKKERDQLIREVENAIFELEQAGLGSKSEDPEEREIFENLQNIVEILKTTL